MDHDNTGGAVNGSCVDCGHNHCDFNVILSDSFEERYDNCSYIFCRLMAILWARDSEPICRVARKQDGGSNQCISDGFPGDIIAGKKQIHVLASKTT